MPITFQGPEMKAKSQNTESLVVFLHGYGASGDDLIQLGRQWSQVLPNTDFIAPNAPHICEQNPNGYQWCSLTDWNAQRIGQELQNITAPLNQYIDRELDKRSLEFSQVALVGFSLGTFMALEAALHRPNVAGVVGYSGGYIHDAGRVKVGKPSVLLVHGEQDQVLPHEATLAADEQLKSMGLEVSTHILPEVEHHIDVQGLGMGAAFLKQHLSQDAEETKKAKA
jgi:phospholipase/carboxylesterase